MKIVVDKYPESCAECLFKSIKSNNVYGGNSEYYDCKILPYAKKDTSLKYKRRTNCPLIEYKEAKEIDDGRN